jgi:hypothetical protein
MQPQNPDLDMYLYDEYCDFSTSPEEFLSRLSAKEERRKPPSGGGQDSTRDFSLPGLNFLKILSRKIFPSKKTILTKRYAVTARSHCWTKQPVYLMTLSLYL